jgi:predicted transcriptional regulator
MARTAQTIGFSVTPDMVEEVRAVADYFASGNRSAFLRLAVADYRSRMRREQMDAFRAEARRQTGGRVLTEDEVRALVADAAHG